jgi:hypothetical protein
VSSCKRLLSILGELKEDEIKTSVRLAQKYPPSTRTLLSALLEELQQNLFIDSLLKTINPITKYKLKGESKALTTSENWNIE